MGLPTFRWVDDEEDSVVPGYPDRTGGPPDRFAREMLEMLTRPHRRTEVARRSAEEARAHDVAEVVDRWAEIYGQ